MICNLLIVLVFKQDVVLVGLHELELPETKLVMAHTEKLVLNIVGLLKQIDQNMLGFVELFLLVTSCLKVESVCDGDLDSSQVIDQFAMFFLHGKDTFATLLAFLVVEFV